eukprot:3556969-Prymnesium_polylepis.1
MLQSRFVVARERWGRTGSCGQPPNNPPPSAAPPPAPLGSVSKAPTAVYGLYAIACNDHVSSLALREARRDGYGGHEVARFCAPGP